jgi:HD-like signal output (HDOD) protein
MTRDELFKNIIDLHPLPKILFRLSDSLGNSQISVDYIEKLISQDPVLTAKMMHLVNSAFFSPVDRIKTLRLAIVHLGFDAIKNIAIQICVQDILKINTNINGFTGETLLAHSVAVRYCTKIILEYLNIDDHEELLSTAAILHDIGLIIEEQLFHQQFISLVTSLTPDAAGPSYLETEKNLFGFSHAQISSLFCETWQLSDVVGAPLQYHHDFMAAPDELKQSSAVLNLADVCALQLHLGFFYPYMQLWEKPMLDFLGLTPANYAKITESCQKAILRF